MRDGVDQPVAGDEPDAPAVNVARDPLRDDDGPVVLRARAVAAGVPDLCNHVRFAANEHAAIALHRLRVGRQAVRGGQQHVGGRADVENGAAARLEDAFGRRRAAQEGDAALDTTPAERRHGTELGGPAGPAPYAAIRTTTEPPNSHAATIRGAKRPGQARKASKAERRRST